LLYPGPLLLVVLGLLAAGAQVPFLSVERLRLVTVLALCAKYLSDAWLIRLINGALPRPSELPLLLLKDIGMCGVWLIGALRRRVNWRGHVMLIGPGSCLYAARRDSDNQPLVVRA
jgi:hypothetical protein